MTNLPTIDMEAAEATAGEDAKKATQYLDHIRKMEITTHPEMRFAVGIAAEIKEKHASVDTQRRGFVEDAKAIIDRANAFFGPALKSLVECEKVLKAKVVGYDLRMATQRDGLLDRLAAEPELADEADACIVPKVPGLSMRRSVKVAITNESAAIAWCIANDRLELLQLNEKAIKALAKATGGRGIDIPGVAVERTSTAAITASKVDRD